MCSTICLCSWSNNGNIFTLSNPWVWFVNTLAMVWLQTCFLLALRMCACNVKYPRGNLWTLCHIFVWTWVCSCMLHDHAGKWSDAWQPLMFYLNIALLGWWWWWLGNECCMCISIILWNLSVELDSGIFSILIGGCKIYWKFLWKNSVISPER
jgi:hypothetical protein